MSKEEVLKDVQDIEDLILCLKARIREKIDSMTPDQIINTITYISGDSLYKKNKTPDDILLFNQINRLRHFMDDAHVLC